MPEQNLRNEYATQLGEIGKMLVQSETVHKLYCWEWVGWWVGVWVDLTKRGKVQVLS